MSLTKRNRRSFRTTHSRQLRLEPLEDRRLLAAITVNSSADGLVVDGMVTLREAIQAANTDASVDGSVAGSGADTITFDSALSGQTITLGGTELAITEALTIDATALASNVIVNANNTSRIFNITASSGDFTLAGLTLTGGRTIGDNGNFSDTTFSGAAVRSLTTGSLTIDQSTVRRQQHNGQLRQRRRDSCPWCRDDHEQHHPRKQYGRSKLQRRRDCFLWPRDAHRQHGQRQQHGGPLRQWRRSIFLWRHHAHQ